MGTICFFRLAGEEGTNAEEMKLAADAVQDTFYRIEKMCNIFDEKSELSRINRALKEGHEVKCSSELWSLLQEARFFYRYSSGAFDVTIAPLMRLWGFHRKNVSLPSEDSIGTVKKNTGLDKVIFYGEKCTLSSGAGTPRFDLGGIAKGYALDKAAETAEKYGIRRGLLNLGGNLRTLKLPPQRNKKNHCIGIRDPL
ncbi:MAG: FAD:protein FMN transferase, partial [Lentisphaeria bacterium]|nr:FAD:protein FMN transferase [Lentisphaeria bacterium]